MECAEPRYYWVCLSEVFNVLIEAFLVKVTPIKTLLRLGVFVLLRALASPLYCLYCIKYN